jgi:hypothetical protein
MLPKGPKQAPSFLCTMAAPCPCVRCSCSKTELALRDALILDIAAEGYSSSLSIEPHYCYMYARMASHPDVQPTAATAAAAVGAELCKGEVACIIKQAYCVFPTKVTVLLLLQR